MQIQSLPFVGFFSIIWLIFIGSLIRLLYPVLRWGLAPRSSEEREFHSYAFLSLILVIAIAVLWVTPYQASNLGISDSVEYTVAAERLLHEGTYTLRIDGRDFPPRYPPWFSALFIAPAMIIVGASLGNAIWPVLISALLGVTLAFSIGRRLSGVFGGIVAAGALLLDPGYRYFSKFPMTDIPNAALSLLIISACLVMKLQKKTSASAFFALGVVCAVLAVMRAPSLVIIIPVLCYAFTDVSFKIKAQRGLLILIPSIVLFAAQAVYQFVAFGSPFRSGYQFWMPWPYDFWTHVFSFQYILTNAQTLCLHTPVIIFAILFFSGWPVLKERKVGVTLDREAYFSLLRMVLTFGVPLILIYLLYFYTTSRFYLPLSLSLYVLLGAFIGAFLGPLEKYRIPSLLLLIVLAAGICGWRSSAPVEIPERRRIAEHIAANTPADALIITGIDPVYLEPLVLRNTKRSLMPISRRIEYASKVVAWQPLNYALPLPTDISSIPRNYLLEAGAKEAVSDVALENSIAINRALDSGRFVYIDTSALERAELQTVIEHFAMQEVAKNLFQITGPWRSGS